MKIAIGNDHTAVEMKNHIVQYLSQKGYSLINYGTDTDERVDYPVFGKRVADAVASGECDLGILICGTGIGISLAANKVKDDTPPQQFKHHSIRCTGRRTCHCRDDRGCFFGGGIRGRQTRCTCGYDLGN